MSEVLTHKLEETGERLLAEEFNEYTVEHLHRYAVAMALCHGKDVLDIASGEGYGSALLASTAKNVIGVDISEDAVAHARNKYPLVNLQFKHGSADAMPLEDQSRDVVVSFETLEHHDKHEMMISEIHRVLRPGGILVMSTPDRRYFGGNPYHVKELDLEEFRTLLSTRFSTCRLYYQKTCFGSLLTPEITEQESKGVAIYSGNHSSIVQHRSMHNPVYNICLAGNGPVPVLEDSFFDGNPVLDEWRATEKKYQLTIQQLSNLNKSYHDIRNSLSFRVGRFMTWPLRVLSRR